MLIGDYVYIKCRGKSYWENHLQEDTYAVEGHIGKIASIDDNSNVYTVMFCSNPKEYKFVGTTDLWAVVE